MTDTSGFYKFDGSLLYGPNFVLNKEFELRRESKDNNTYPVDGWYWFDSEEQARTFLKIPLPDQQSSVEFNPDLSIPAAFNVAKKPYSIFEPTPVTVIDQIFKEVAITSNDIIYDLGCGTGDVLIYCATNFGSTGIGIDVDDLRIVAANKLAELSGVSDKVTFKKGNFYYTTTPDATAVYLYLTQESLNLIEPRLFALPTGTKIISLLTYFYNRTPVKEISTDLGTCYYYEVGA